MAAGGSLGQHDDAFVWKDGRYRVRRWFAADVIWFVLLVALVVLTIVGAVVAYHYRDEGATKVERGSAPAPAVVVDVAA